ncbi:hypothetical protein IE077_001636 [Cardiosporidium cionae]|uniref:subtilisin n=1 Tax=Cardiosporidium cionae TaxID=476202 RepID=A0ABQ7JCJ5_9APIC|nr:hypothetical protein IE077_001636 [Cardiosporidium cionae]|eukprot:KAF8821751.1 hypothetical protein IE077_001636 [Cardiosporidium cionae]
MHHKSGSKHFFCNIGYLWLMLLWMTVKIAIATAQSASFPCITIVCSLELNQVETLQAKADRLFSEVQTSVLRTVNPQEIKNCATHHQSLPNVRALVLNFVPISASEATLNYLLQQSGIDCAKNSFLTSYFLQQQSMPAATHGSQAAPIPPQTSNSGFGAVPSVGSLLSASSGLSHSVYRTGVKATEILDEFARKKTAQTGGLFSNFLNAFETSTAKYIQPIATSHESSNGTNISRTSNSKASAEDVGLNIETLASSLTSPDIIQLNTSTIPEVQLLNAFVGAGFNTVLNMMQSQQAKAVAAQGKTSISPAVTSGRLPQGRVSDSSSTSSLGRNLLASQTSIETFKEMQAPENAAFLYSKTMNPTSKYPKKYDRVHSRLGETINIVPSINSKENLREKDTRRLLSEEVSRLWERLLSFSAHKLDSTTLRTLSNIPEASTPSASSSPLPKMQTNITETAASLSEEVLSADSVLGLVSGCACDLYPDGAACPLKALGLNVRCISFNVWDNTRQGAELSDVLLALDAAIAQHASTIIFPMWFGSFSSASQARQAPRILRNAFRRASESGALIVLSAGDDCISGTDKGNLASHPCDDMAGISGVCSSSVTASGELSPCANVPPMESLFAVGKDVSVLNKTFQGTALAAAQVAGVANLVQAITAVPPLPKEGLFTHLSRALLLPPELQSSLIFNPKRRILMNDSLLAFPSRSLQVGSSLERKDVGGALDAVQAVVNALTFTNQNILSESADSSACTFSNVKYIGTPFFVEQLASAKKCRQSCDSRQECHFFSFDSSQICYIYSTIKGQQDSVSTLSSLKNCSHETATNLLNLDILNNIGRFRSTILPGAALPIAGIPLAEATTANSITGNLSIPSSNISQPAVGDTVVAQTASIMSSILGQSSSPSPSPFSLPAVAFPAVAPRSGSPAPSPAISSSMSSPVVTSSPASSFIPALTLPSSRSDWVAAAQTAFNASNTFFKAIPLQKLIAVGSQLSSSGFYRKRGIKTLGTAVGGDKTDNLPLPGARNPTVSCAHLGMTCCIPQSAAPNWKNSDNMPYLGTRKGMAQCKSNYIPQANSLCATTRYDDNVCGLVTTETKDFVIFQQSLVVPDRSSNDALCQCMQTKNTTKAATANTEKTFVGVARWAYSLSAVKKEETRASSAKKLTSDLSSAVAWAQLISSTGASAFDKAANRSVEQVRTGAATNTLQFLTQLPGLIANQQVRALLAVPDLPTSIAADSHTPRVLQASTHTSPSSSLPSIFSFTPTQNSDPTVTTVTSSSFVHWTPSVPSPLFTSPPETSTEICLLPWPRSCSAIRSECEHSTDSALLESTKCQPIQLLKDGCPNKEIGFTVEDSKPGLLSFSTHPFKFSGGAPFRLNCRYTLISCSMATVDKQCSVNTSTNASPRSLFSSLDIFRNTKSVEPSIIQNNASLGTSLSTLEQSVSSFFKTMRGKPNAALSLPLPGESSNTAIASPNSSTISQISSHIKNEVDTFSAILTNSSVQLPANLSNLENLSSASTFLDSIFSSYLPGVAKTASDVLNLTNRFPLIFGNTSRSNSSFGSKTNKKKGHEPLLFEPPKSKEKESTIEQTPSSAPTWGSILGKTDETGASASSKGGEGGTSPSAENAEVASSTPVSTTTTTTSNSTIATSEPYLGTREDGTSVDPSPVSSVRASSNTTATSSNTPAISSNTTAISSNTTATSSNTTATSSNTTAISSTTTATSITHGNSSSSSAPTSVAESTSATTAAGTPSHEITSTTTASPLPNASVNATASEEKEYFWECYNLAIESQGSTIVTVLKHRPTNETLRATIFGFGRDAAKAAKASIGSTVDCIVSNLIDFSFDSKFEILPDSFSGEGVILDKYQPDSRGVPQELHMTRVPGGASSIYTPKKVNTGQYNSTASGISLITPPSSPFGILLVLLFSLGCILF